MSYISDSILTKLATNWLQREATLLAAEDQAAVDAMISERQSHCGTYAGHKNFPQLLDEKIEALR